MLPSERVNPIHPRIRDQLRLFLRLRRAYGIIQSLNAATESAINKFSRIHRHQRQRCRQFVTTQNPSTYLNPDC